MKAFFIFLTISFASFLNAQQAPPKEFYDKVVGITDGDSFKVLYKKQEFKIRLTPIDSPERNQDFGQKAKQYASDLCFGKTIRVVWREKDRYQRILADLYLGETSINKEMVRAGYAWHFTRYSKDNSYSKLEPKPEKTNADFGNSPRLHHLGNGGGRRKIVLINGINFSINLIHKKSKFTS